MGKFLRVLEFFLLFLSTVLETNSLKFNFQPIVTPISFLYMSFLVCNFTMFICWEKVIFILIRFIALFLGPVKRLDWCLLQCIFWFILLFSRYYKRCYHQHTCNAYNVDQKEYITQKYIKWWPKVEGIVDFSPLMSICQVKKLTGDYLY